MLVTLLLSLSASAEDDGWIRRHGGEMVQLTAAGACYERGRDDGELSERPAHEVCLGHDLAVLSTEVTQRMYGALVDGEDPSAHPGADRPVERVSWEEAVAFANLLSEAEGLAPCYVRVEGGWRWPDGPSCAGYRLPTEAEWEYAADDGHRYAGGRSARRVAWVRGNSGRETHPVAGKAPNARGLYDMSGNVAEWVWDVYDSYPAGRITDPVGPDAGMRRVQRGGSYASRPMFAAVGYRSLDLPHAFYDSLGFRLVRSLPLAGE